jgi:hypothetical protein
MKKLLVVVALAGALALAGSQAYASCGGSVPMFHQLGGFFQCDNSRGPVASLAYEISNSAVNSGTFVITQPLDPTSVAVNFDWGNDGINGCPQDATGFPGTNLHRIMIVVVANDGTGLLATISGADPQSTYQVENAHPFDGSNILPIPCTNQNGKPNVLSVSSSSISLHFNTPLVFSDCDPNSVAVLGLGLVCPDGFTDQGSIAGIYTSVQTCGTSPYLDRTATNTCSLNRARQCSAAGTLPGPCLASEGVCNTAAWTKSAVVPDALGNATIQATRPTGTDSTGKPLCLFVGGTVNVGGSESGSITGYTQLANVLAAPTKILNLKATKSQAKIDVTFSTDQQVGLGGFKVYVAGAKGLSEIGRINPTGGDQGASYKATYSMSDVKGSKTITVKAFDASGREIASAQASF